MKIGVIDFVLATFEGRTDISGINETLLGLKPKVVVP